MKKHHWHVFQHEKLFEKQPLPHYQTPRLEDVMGLIMTLENLEMRPSL
jgi:hypothetical protein